jgi:membrane protease YdiL (CAAX protease family)
VIAITPYALTLQSEFLAETPLPLPLAVLLPIQWAQNMLLFGVLAAIGLFLARRIGLGLPVLESWLAGKPEWNRVKVFWIPAVAAGVLVAGAIIVLDVFLFGPPLAAELSQLNITIPETVNPPAWQGFLASFYGGIAEEVLLRLFLFTLLAWLGSRVSRTPEGRPTTAILWLANILSAILFGLGHLPATAAIGLPMDALVVSRALVLNGLAGLVFGWFYWKFGLESAMLAHFSADIVLHVIFPLLNGLGQ